MRAMDIVFLDFSGAFDTIPYEDILWYYSLKKNFKKF